MDIKEIFADKRKLRQFFDRNVPLHFFLAVSSQGRLICCPFHNDETASAKLYDDQDGTQRLYCFSCRRQFSSFDFLTMVKKEDPISYLIRNFDEESLTQTAAGFEFVKPPEREVDVDLEGASLLLPDVVAFLDHVFPSVSLENEV